MRISSDITNPNSLWRDYDVNALPLNETALSDKTEDSVTVKEYYFDGFTTTDGRARAYIKILENPQSRGVILYLSDKFGDNDGTARYFYDYGYTVAVLDYLGERDDAFRFTIYPQSLSSCNNYGKSAFDAPEDALSCCWYIWTCLARRAILLLKNKYDGQNIYALGKGLGGSTVYKLTALDDGLKGCATLLNILPAVNGTGNPIINYRAAFDNSSYAPLSKTPIFISVASNDEDGSLDHMCVLADNTVSLRGFRIVERAFSGGMKSVYPQINGFFSSCAADGEPKFVRPEIKAANSENKLYFNIRITSGDEPPPTDNVRLFTSFCVDNPTRRSWMSIKPLGIGDGEYMANVDVLRNEKHVYAFVNVSDDDGYITSSGLLTLIPKTLGIPPMSVVNRRLIYDGSMGKDVWTSPDGGSISAVSGLFGIDGITSDSHSLVTFKPGDPLYRAANGSLLQIMLCGKPQTVNVAVSNETESYGCQINVPSDDNWHKITLNHFDFKSDKGPLSDWSDIIMLAFSAESDFIIGSVLWV